MTMMDEKEFFREATLRICGSLEIEKALWQSLIYIRDFMPAGQMSFHVYHRDQGIVETVAHATPDAGEAMSVRSPLSPRARRQVEAQRSIRVRGDRPPWGRPGGRARPAARLGALDLSGVVMDLVLEKKMLGVFSVFNNGRGKIQFKPCPAIKPPERTLRRCANQYVAIPGRLMKLRDLLADDNRYLQDELRRLSGEDVVGADFGLKGVMELVRQVAPMDSPVLLLGETGTGKEVIAGAIHKSSARKDKPFITVNCGAIPATLLDSELFGYERGGIHRCSVAKARTHRTGPWRDPVPR